MPVRLKKLVPCVLGGCMLIAAAPVLADVTLSSPDGRWVATIENEGGGAGQCNGVSDMSQPNVSYRQFLANTRHYARMGTSISYGSALSQPMQDHFHLLSFASSDDAYTAVLACDDVLGLIAIVHGEMASGAAGGLRVSLSFRDTSPSAMILAQYSVKPFVYANMNVDGQMLNNAGSWVTDHFTQHANNTGTGNERWFRGRSPAAHQSMLNSFMQDALDNGMTELANIANTGPGDINAAISFAAGTLGPDNTHTIAYAIGNENVTIPSGFGLTPNAGTVAISSPDNRWSASINTGNAYLDHGSAGEVTAVYDFNMPLDTARFATLASYYLGVNTLPQFIGDKVKDTFERVAFLYAADSTSMASAVLNSKNWPGLVLIIDARMYPGGAGGLVVCMKFVDTLGRDMNIAPVVFADIDCDNQTTDTGGFNVDHFYQRGPGFSPFRGFKAASFSTYQGGLSSALQNTLNSGVVTLGNSTVAGPVNIGTAFAFHPWPLSGDEPYVSGFALGSPAIHVPSEFVFPSVWFTCADDIAPAGGDGQVNIDDLLAVISGWGMCAGGCDGDIVPVYVGDGLVNIDDLLSVISNWGDCFPK